MSAGASTAGSIDETTRQYVLRLPQAPRRGFSTREARTSHCPCSWWCATTVGTKSSKARCDAIVVENAYFAERRERR